MKLKNKIRDYYINSNKKMFVGGLVVLLSSIAAIIYAVFGVYAETSYTSLIQGGTFQYDTGGSNSRWTHYGDKYLFHSRKEVDGACAYDTKVIDNTPEEWYTAGICKTDNNSDGQDNDGYYHFLLDKNGESIENSDEKNKLLKFETKDSFQLKKGIKYRLTYRYKLNIPGSVYLYFDDLNDTNDETDIWKNYVNKKSLVTTTIGSNQKSLTVDDLYNNLYTANYSSSDDEYLDDYDNWRTFAYEFTLNDQASDTSGYKLQFWFGNLLSSTENNISVDFDNIALIEMPSSDDSSGDDSQTDDQSGYKRIRFSEDVNYINSNSENSTAKIGFMYLNKNNNDMAYYYYYRNIDPKISIKSIVPPTRDGYVYQGFKINYSDPNYYIDENGTINDSLMESYYGDTTLTDKTLVAYYQPEDLSNYRKITLDTPVQFDSGDRMGIPSDSTISEFYAVIDSSTESVTYKLSTLDPSPTITKIVAPTKEGYTFNGFKDNGNTYINSDGSFNDDLFKKLTGEIKLVADFTTGQRNCSQLITLDSNGGETNINYLCVSSDGNSVYIGQEETGDKVTKIEVPVKDGYVFDGYYYEKEGYDQSYNPVINSLGEFYDLAIVGNTSSSILPSGANGEDYTLVAHYTEGTETSSIENSSNPTTGDNIKLFWILISVSALGLLTSIVLIIKARKK